MILNDVVINAIKVLKKHCEETQCCTCQIEEIIECYDYCPCHWNFEDVNCNV